MTALRVPGAVLPAVRDLPGRLERLSRRPRVRAVLALISTAAFVAITVVSIRALPDGTTLRARPLVAVAVLAVAAVGVNTLEYRLSGWMLGVVPPLGRSLRVTVIASASNVLPLPGAALVRVGALRGDGHRTAAAATITAGVGLMWVAAAATVGSVAAAAADRSALAVGGVAVAVVVGALAVAAIGAGRPAPGLGRSVGAAAVLELCGVGLTSLRMWAAVRAVGVDARLTDGAVLAVASIVAVAAGVFPGGLGLREALSAAAAAVSGLAAAAGALASALDRAVQLVVLAAALPWVLRWRRDRDPSTATDGTGPVSAGHRRVAAGRAGDARAGDARAGDPHAHHPPPSHAPEDP